MKRQVLLAALLLAALAFRAPPPAAAQRTLPPASLPVASVCVPFLPPFLEAHPAPGVPKKTTPVVIVGGTLAPEILYFLLEERLRSEGYAVQFFPLPNGGMSDIVAASQTLGCVIDEVLARTHAIKVHLIGHSQGVLTSRAYIKFQNGENKVETLVSLAGPNQGTRVVSGFFLEYPMPTLLGCFPGNPNPPPPCIQLAVGSTLVQQVNDRPPGDPIYYTNFATTDDAWVVPHTNSFFPYDCDKTNGLGELLKCNIHIQTYCPQLAAPVDHVGLPFDTNVWNGIRLALLHRPIDLGCGLPPATPSNLECESTEAREPLSGVASYPEAIARVPAAKLAQGFVRVGSSCEVSRFGNGSVHAAVMVRNVPEGSDGWACKGADPALTPNPAWARATVNYCRIEPKVVPSQRLECQTLSASSALAFYPQVSVEMTPAMIADGYQVVSGGCTSSYFGNGSTHAESLVRSSRTWNGLGWTCQGADPTNISQQATVAATLVACRSKIDNADRNAFAEAPELQCQVTPGPLVAGFGPISAVDAADPAQRVVGGECELSWFGNGSTHAEFVVKNGQSGFSGWACQGADPPFTPNLASVKSSVIACNVSLGVR